jgi:chemotaxis protein MotB
MGALRFGTLAAATLCVLLAMGCQNKVAEENKRLWQQNRELQSRLSESETRLRSAPDPNELATMQQELAARDQKIAELEASLRQPSQGSDPGISGIETSYDPAAGTMTVNLPGDVLFDSGKATLKQSSKSTLDKIVQALKSDYAGKQVYVDGHTDKDPINKTKGQWEDNLDLSANRAMAVARYLTSQGVDADLVAIRGFGEHHPKGNKAQSRRVEIVVQVK